MTPAVAEERAMAVGLPVMWRRMSLLTQVVLFILTAAAVAAFYLLMEELRLPKGIVAAAVSIAVAELLIRRVHFWRTGVESALWIAGLVAFIASLPSSGKPEAILAFVAAAAIAGWRMRNALFGASAFVLIAAYLAAKHWPWIAAAFSIAVCLGALVAELRIWRRPSAELLWQALLIVMPIVAYVVVKIRPHVVEVFVVLAALLLATGIHDRLRVVLLASAISIGIAGIAVRPRIPLSDEAVLIAAGAIALAIAAALMRALRGRSTGFVTLHEPHELDELLQIAASLPLAVPSAAAAKPAHAGGGGEFGGAGASGDF